MHLLVLSAFRQRTRSGRRLSRSVSMHLLVLSAFRRHGFRCGEAGRFESLNAPFGAQCFPTNIEVIVRKDYVLSQCTFWCSVLSDTIDAMKSSLNFVSMHLLVLSAFRP